MELLYFHSLLLCNRAWKKRSLLLCSLWRQQWLVGHAVWWGHAVGVAALMGYHKSLTSKHASLSCCWQLELRDNSACEMFSSLEVTGLPILHLLGAKKRAYKWGKTAIMGLNLHALALFFSPQGALGKVRMFKFFFATKKREAKLVLPASLMCPESWSSAVKSASQPQVRFSIGGQWAVNVHQALLLCTFKLRNDPVLSVLWKKKVLPAISGFAWLFPEWSPPPITLKLFS